MTVLINGQEQQWVPYNDRGLAYADGVFETILINKGRAVLLDKHLERLFKGLDRLSIQLEQRLITTEIERILFFSSAPVEVLKLTITRGPGGRGYRPGASSPTRILSLSPYQRPVFNSPGIKVFECRQRLAEQPALAGIKHLNRLEQVLGSLEWPDDSFAEGLMLSTSHAVIEGTKSNLFVSLNGQWLTPELTLCGIEGVLRAHLLERCLGKIRVAQVSLEDLKNADECLLANSVAGVMPVAELQLLEGRVAYTPGALCELATGIFAELLGT